MRSNNHRGQVGRTKKTTVDHEETNEERDTEIQGRIQVIQGDTKEMQHHLGTTRALIKIKESMNSLAHVF